jgi:hypothetical protein
MDGSHSAEHQHMPGVAQGNNKSEHQDASSRHRKRSHCGAWQYGVPADYFQEPDIMK